MKSKVAIVRCGSYDENEVLKAVKEGLDLIGGIASYVHSGEKILLKPNVLLGSSPDEHVTTHPSVLNAILKLLSEMNLKLSYGDSSAFSKPSVTLKKTGLMEIAEKYKVKPGEFENGRIVSFPEGLAAKEFYLASAALEADGIISLCKMKTHRFTTITGAVKNQFGCVVGANKAAFHVKIPNASNFSKMLVDINNFLKPRLFIMDGIIAMEGNGPSGGDLVPMNCIIVSNDPIALDSTFCRMIDLEPSKVSTNLYGKISGLGNYDESEIEYFGEKWQDFLKKDFKVDRNPIYIGGFVAQFKDLKNWIIPRPVIEKKFCVRCGICADICPVEGKALQFSNPDKKDPPVYDYKKCIRCYCCQETCPEKAITVVKPFLGRLLTGK